MQPAAEGISQRTNQTAFLQGGGGGEAGLTIIRMGEREGPRSNRAGKCWWERLVLKGFYGLPREGFFKGLGFGIESKSGLRLSGRRVL